MSQEGVRIEGPCLVREWQGLQRAAAESQTESMYRVRISRQGVGFDAEAGLLDCFLETAPNEAEEEQGVPRTGLEITRIQFEGPLKRGLRSPPVPLEHQLGARHGVVAFRQVRGERYDALCRVEGGPVVLG